MMLEAASPMDLFWMMFFVLLFGTLGGAYVVQTYFPVGEDNERHWVYSDYYKSHQKKQ